MFFSQGLNYEFDEDGKLVILDSYFMAYHSVVKTSKDYYTALDNARKMAANVSEVISDTLGKPIEIFPYR